MLKKNFISKNGTLLVYEQDYLRQLHGEQHYERCQNFCQSFHADWKNDDMIINLVSTKNSFV